MNWDYEFKIVNNLNLTQKKIHKVIHVT